MRYSAERQGSGEVLFREVQAWRDTWFGPMLLVAGAGLVLGFGYALCVQHYPLTRLHCFAYTDIKEYRGRTYRPIREYGGWGVRMGLFGRGKAFNVSGNRGVQLVFMDGRKFLIGSRRTDELARAIAVAKRDGG